MSSKFWCKRVDLLRSINVSSRATDTRMDAFRSFGSLKGPTGRIVLEKLLSQGHSVTAIVRSPEKFLVEHKHLKVIKGDATDKDTFVDHLSEKDAVISCLGAHGTNMFKHTTLYSTSIKAIHEAMKIANISRIICVTSWFTEKKPDHPRFVEWFLKPFTMAGFIHDMAASERYLEETDLNYTIVRPPGLNTKPGTNAYLYSEGQYVDGARWIIPREDVASFIVEVSESEEFNRKAMAVGIK